MKIQINNDFQLALSVLANGTAEPLTYATDIEVAVQNLDAPRVRCTLAPVVVNGNVVTVAVDSTVLNTTGRYLAAITYVINGARRYAENGDAFTLVRSAAEADIEGESAAADLYVKFEASGKDGLSAYELAKQAGYAGTFEEWLAAGENANNAALLAKEGAALAATATKAAADAAQKAVEATGGANAAANKANAAANGVTGEITRIDAAAVGSLQVDADSDKVAVKGTSLSGAEVAAVDIPAATTENAGVMSAEDKKIVNGIDAAIEEGEKRALRKLFIAAGALYNDTSADIIRKAPWGETVIHKVGHYYLNGLGDITEKEMLAIYDAGKYWISDNAAGFGSQRARTNLPPLSYTDYFYKTYNLVQTFNNDTVEVVMLNDADYMPPSSVAVVKVNPISYFGQGAVKLKRVIGTIDVGIISQNSVVNAPNLEYISIKNLKKSLRINSALLSKESILYIIQNAAPESAITITLHADVYARLAEDVDIVAALEAQSLVTLVSL